MNDELHAELRALPAKIELVVLKAIKLHEAEKHKSISLGNLITIFTLLGIAAAAVLTNL